MKCCLVCQETLGYKIWLRIVFIMLEIVLGVKILGKEKVVRIYSNHLILFGSGERIRTSDLWVMSPTSYQTAPPRDMSIFKTGDFTPLYQIFVKELFWQSLSIWCSLTMIRNNFGRMSLFSYVTHKAVNKFSRHKIRRNDAGNRRQLNHVKAANFTGTRN